MTNATDNRTTELKCYIKCIDDMTNDLLKIADVLEEHQINVKLDNGRYLNPVSAIRSKVDVIWDETQAIAATLGSEPPYDELLRCLENDWHISASWDGLRKFWCVELTEEGVKLRDATHGALTADQLRDAINDLQKNQPYCYDPDKPLDTLKTIGRYIGELQSLALDMARELRSLNNDGIPTDCMEHEQRIRELGIEVNS